MSTGWTYDQVGEQFDLPRLKSMMEYWRIRPPVHILVASYVGYKPPEDNKVIDGEGEDVSDFIKAMSAFQQG